MLRGVALWALLSGCAFDVEIGRECPRSGAVCSPRENPPPPVQSEAPGVATVAPAPLGAALLRGGERLGGAITLACGEACIDVTATATGGVTPYRFVWDDGVEGPERHFCPATTLATSVRVRDAAPEGPTGSGPAEAMVALSIARAACPSEPVMTPMPDPPTQAPTMQAPSSNAASLGCAALAARPPDQEWISRGWCSQAGSTVLLIFAQAVKHGEKMEVRASGAGPFPGQWMLQLWGSGAGCDLEEKLGEFAVGQSPLDVRVAFTPHYDHRLLTLTAVQNDGGTRSVPDIEYAVCP